MNLAMKSTEKFAIDKDVEDEWINFIEESELILLPVIKEVMNFILQLMKRRLYQGIFHKTLDKSDLEDTFVE